MADVHMDNDNQDIPRLRIVHIISGDRWAGAEVQAYTLLSELAKDHDVFAIVLNHGELANKLKRNGVIVKILDEEKLSASRLFFQIRSNLASIKPNVVHTHRQKENILGSIANKLSVNARCVRTIHGASEFTPSRTQRFQRWLDRLSGNCLQDAIICVSADLRDKLAHSFNPNKLVVVNNGIDPSLINENITPNFLNRETSSDIHIGLIGRLEPVKRGDLFIDAASILMQTKDKNYKFHIFGDGSLLAALKKQATDKKLSNELIFHGHTHSIHSAIKALDYVVMCSDHEGLPMTALESLALGTPVLAHDTGGLSYLLSNYPFLLTKNHTAEGYASLIQAVLKRKFTVILPHEFHIKNTAKLTLAQYY